MHGDVTTNGLRARICEHIENKVLPAYLLDHLERITFTNIWRPLPLVHNGVLYRFNQGTSLTGVLAFSLSDNWFVDLPGIVPAVV
jgi:hypothetical protein